MLVFNLLMLLYCSPAAATSTAGQAAYSEVSFPDPGGNPVQQAACGVNNTSYICDPSNKLTDTHSK